MGFWYGVNEIAPFFKDELNMKLLVSLLLLGCVHGALAAPVMSVFISFSMPEQLLQETLIESARLHIPAILNGLHQNSMPKTVAQIMTLSKVIPNLNLQIDPTAFARFKILQVPALVVSSDKGFDVMYGNLTLTEALKRIAEHANESDSGLTKDDVRRIIGE